MSIDRSRLIAILACATCIVLADRAAAEEVEHPTYTNWSRFPVGTSVTIRATTTIKNASTIVDTKTTLVSRDDKAIVISKKFGIDDKPGTFSEDGVETTVKRFFPLLPGIDKTRIGKPQGNAGQGVETVEIRGKSYRAEWYETRASTEAGPSVTRTWISMEMPGQVLKSTTEVKAVGKKTIEEVIAVDIPRPE
jgi:hypothetical protein